MQVLELKLMKVCACTHHLRGPHPPIFNSSPCISLTIHTWIGQTLIPYLRQSLVVMTTFLQSFSFSSLFYFISTIVFSSFFFLTLSSRRTRQGKFLKLMTDGFQPRYSCIPILSHNLASEPVSHFLNGRANLCGHDQAKKKRCK